MSLRIKHIRLKNICQFRDLDWTFCEGSTIITGPNGAGKSNLINSIYAGITGDFRRFAGGKASAICQQAEQKERSFIELDLEVHGNSVQLVRSLRPSNQKLEFAGKSYTGADQINEVFEQIAGTSRYIIGEYTFVAQDAMRSFFSLTAADRAKHFARLCQTVWIEDLWIHLGTHIDRVKEELINLPSLSQVQELQDELLAAESRYADAREDLKSAKERLAPEGKLKSARRAVQDWDKLLDLQYAQKAASEALDALKAASTVQDDRERLEGLKNALELEFQDLEGLEAKQGEQAIEEAVWRGVVGKQDKAEYLRKEAARIDEELHNLVPPEEPETACDLDELREQIAQLQASVHSDTKFLKLLDSGTKKCPTCGTSVDDLAEEEKQVRKRLPKNQEELNQLKALQNRWLCYLTERDQYGVLHQELIAARDSVTTELKMMPSKKEVQVALEGLETLRKLNLELEECRGRVRSLERSIRDKERSLESYHRDLHAHEKILNDLNEKIASSTADEGRAKRAQAYLDKHQEVQKEVYACEAVIKECRRQKIYAEEQLKQSKEKLAEVDRKRRWVNLLNRGRDVVHRDNLPSRIHRRVLGSLLQRINMCLGDFESPFHVTADEDLSLVAHFNNGTVIPALGLSGGQQMILAVSLRWPINDLAAPGMALLVLDEPTSGLDQRNRDGLVEAFERIGDLSRARGEQLLVITHDMILARAFDEMLKIPEDVNNDE